MSIHQAFRRVAVPAQVAQQLKAGVIPAPTRGIIQSENDAFMAPGAALVSDNWIPTMRGVKIRGGCIRWCVLSTPVPIISGFEYVSGNIKKMFAGQQTELYDVTFAGAASLVKSGQGSGNYAATQLANASGDYLTVVNDNGDAPLRFDGLTWTVLNSGQINGPAGTVVAAGLGLVHVWKYRSRLFFIERESMNAWYLPVDAIQGTLAQIPLSGSATKGGKLLFGATWSIDVGDGIDDKCVFVTTEGELLIFTGSNPSDPNNWRQEGRYKVGAPMGMNASVSVGGDLLIATVDGIVPISAAITKDPAQLELVSVTRNIKNMWRAEVDDKRDHPWTMKVWNEYGGMFVTWPGAPPGKRVTGIANVATGAWGRIVGWDAMCWLYLNGNLFFGTSDGIIMQADRSGYDDGLPYVCTLVGGWGILGVTQVTSVWHQARATFLAKAAGEPFVPQLTAAVDFTIKLPQPPPVGPDPGTQDIWDQGLWDQAKWDQPSLSTPTTLNTRWVSIGRTGYAHAPIIQVTIGQQAKPSIELISISTTYEALGMNV